MRNDIHRPSAPEFDPEKYSCFAVYDLNPEWPDPDSARHRVETLATLRERGYRSGAGSTSQCGHCGAHLRYAALMVRQDVKQWIFVGETCLDGRFEMTKGEFDQLRKSAALNRDRMAKADKFAALCAEHPALAYAAYADRISGADDALHIRAGAGWALSTMTDIARKARQYGEVSDRQVAFLERLLVEVDEKVAAQIVKDATPQPELLITGKRQVVEGTIVSTRWQDNDYGYGGTLKALVEQPDGTRVWGSIPAAATVEQGDSVQFSAGVTRSDKDPSFGFWARPTQFVVRESGRQIDDQASTGA